MGNSIFVVLSQKTDDLFLFTLIHPQVSILRLVNSLLETTRQLGQLESRAGGFDWAKPTAGHKSKQKETRSH